MPRSFFVLLRVAKSEIRARFCYRFAPYHLPLLQLRHSLFGSCTIAIVRYTDLSRDGQTASRGTVLRLQPPRSRGASGGSRR